MAPIVIACLLEGVVKWPNCPKFLHIRMVWLRSCTVRVGFASDANSKKVVSFQEEKKVKFSVRKRLRLFFF